MPFEMKRYELHQKHVNQRKADNSIIPIFEFIFSYLHLTAKLYNNVIYAGVRSLKDYINFLMNNHHRRNLRVIAHGLKNAKA